MNIDFLRPRTRFSEITPPGHSIDTSFVRSERLSDKYIAEKSDTTHEKTAQDHRIELIIEEEAPDLEQKENDEDFVLEINQELPFQQEILLIRGRHYHPTPTDPEGAPLPPPPDWVIISSDINILRFLPIQCNDSNGAILAREQAIIQHDILRINTHNPPIPTTIEEFDRGLLDLRLIIGPNRLRESPFRLFWNDEQISHIRNEAQIIVYNILNQQQININSSNNTWNLLQINCNYDFSKNFINSYSPVQNNTKIDLIAFGQDNRSINQNNATFNFTNSPFVEETEDIQAQAIIYDSDLEESSFKPELEFPIINSDSQDFQVTPSFNPRKITTETDSLEAIPKRNLLTVNPRIDKLHINKISNIMTEDAQVDNLINKPIINTITSNPVNEEHKVIPINKTIISEPINEEHKVESINITKTSNPVYKSHDVIPDYQNVTSTPTVLSHDIKVIEGCKTSVANVESLKVTVNEVD
ncbi:titin [Histomonas meleagridis]|nr:titin [Histomonas meleagridis]